MRADVAVTTKRGVTPMSVAVTAFGSTPILKLLAAKGAKAEDRLMSPVAQKGDLEAIQFLLGIGVRAGDATTLAAAVTGRCEACVRLLVEKGASAKTVRPDGAGVLNETAKRAMPNSPSSAGHGASLDSKIARVLRRSSRPCFPWKRQRSRPDGEWLLSGGRS